MSATGSPAITTTTASASALAPPARRIAAVDIARGVALVAMALYHATWDLGFLRLTPENYALTGAGKDSARLIAGSFLMLTGIGLVLAHGDGLRPRAFLHRFAKVAAAALAITAVTVVAFPDSYIFFGILHCIAATSVLALPFLRAPATLTLAASVLAFAAPLLLRQPVFDAPILAFLGLGTRLPVANDYVPLFPWFGAVLAGIAAARAGRIGERVGSGPVPGVLRPVAWLGRHSLAFYLLHQPVLLGLAYAIVSVTGPNPGAEASGFQRAYEANCARAGGSGSVCVAAGQCLVGRLRAENLWAAAKQDRYSVDDRERAVALSQQCFADAMAAGVKDRR